MIKIISKSLVFFLSLLILISPIFVLAQTPTGGGAPTQTPTGGGAPTQTVKYSINIKNPFKSNNVKDLLTTIVNDILIPIGSVIATVMVIYAGFLFVTARGNATQIETAKKALLYAVIGAAILLGAWVIINAIDATITKLKS